MAEQEQAPQNRFLVPQYIDTEPKVIGAIAVRQFILLLVASMIAFMLWKIFENINQLAGIGPLKNQS